MAAAQRNDRITVIVVNNTRYGMIGGQMAPTTLSGQRTETTPYGRNVEKAGHPMQGPETVPATAGKRAYIARAKKMMGQGPVPCPSPIPITRVPKLFGIHSRRLLLYTICKTEC